MKENIEIFYQYLDTAEVIYLDDVCITNLQLRCHSYHMLREDIEKVCINPNHTFTVLYKTGEVTTFEFYILKGHFYPTDDICILREEIKDVK